MQCNSYQLNSVNPKAFMNITLCYLCSQQFKLTVPKMGTVVDLCRVLSKLTDIPFDKVSDFDCVCTLVLHSCLNVLNLFLIFLHTV